jgi:hypothetical protein
LDETSSLSKKTGNALQEILFEHERLTGEPITIAFLRSDKKQNEANSRKLFEQQQISRYGKNAGIQITIFPTSNDVLIENGIRFESALTPQVRDDIIDKATAAIGDGHPGIAAGRAVLIIFEAIDSPLLNITAPRTFLETLAADEDRTSQEKIPSAAWLIPIIIIGSLILGAVLYFATAPEIHIMPTGWFRLKPWEILSKKMLRQPKITPGGTIGRW